MEEITNKIWNCFQKNNHRISQILDSEEAVKWIPLLLYRSPDKYFGITENGCWVVEGSSGMRYLDSPNEYWRVKILLERSLDDIQAEFNKNLSTILMSVCNCIN